MEETRMNNASLGFSVEMIITDFKNVHAEILRKAEKKIKKLVK